MKEIIVLLVFSLFLGCETPQKVNWDGIFGESDKDLEMTDSDQNNTGNPDEVFVTDSDFSENDKMSDIDQNELCDEDSDTGNTGEPDEVNTRSTEFADNGIDDNGNGEIDEIIICDEGLSLQVDDYPGNAEKLAKGMDICEGLVKAELSLAGNPVSE